MSGSMNEESEYQQKSRKVAAVLAIFLGWFGAHKFYLGQNKKGIVFVLFFWTYIPFLIGITNGVHYLNMTDEEFHRRLTGGDEAPVDKDELNTPTENDSLGWREQWKIARKTSLADLFGIHWAVLYITGGVLLYAAAFAGLAYFSYGSVEVFVSAIKPSGPTDDISGSIISNSIIAGFVTVVVVRASIKYKSGNSTQNELIRSLVVPFAVSFWGFMFLFPAFLIILPIYSALSIPDETMTGVGLIISFGLTSVWLIRRTHHTFPDRFYFTRLTIQRAIAGANTSLDNADNQITDEEFDRATRSVTEAQDRLNQAKRSLSDNEVWGSKITGEINDTRERIQKTARRLVSEAIRVGASQLEEGSHGEAFEILLNARPALTILKDSQPEGSQPERSDAAKLETQLQSHLDTARSELEAIADDIEREIDEHLDEADTARVNGRHDHAADVLACALDLAEQLQQLQNKKMTSMPMDEIKELQEKIKEKQQEAELQSEIDQYTALITTLLDIDYSEVDGNRHNEFKIQTAANEYKRIYQTLESIQRLQSNFPEFPWDKVQIEFKNFMTGKKHLSRSTLHEYHVIVNNAEKVLTYLQTAPETHASIDAEEWREAVSVAHSF
jgi:TM2 domain-containing membrane protein YozV